tara:strand:+ start:9465 stop:20303 length:10839 start_codon:yes stop_codon:yes gene_type:complete
MAKPFNLTAQLNVTGPVGLRPVVNSIKKQLSGISTKVNVKLDPSAQRGVKNLNKDIIQLNRSLKSAAGHASSLSASMSKLGSSLKTVKSSSAASAKGLSSVGTSAQQTGKQLAVARTEMEDFGRISGLALRRYAGFTVATTITFGFTRAVGNALGEAIKFERELIKIAQVTGKSMVGLKGLTAEIGRLATTLGVSSSELLEVSRILSQTGLNATQVKTALSALAKSSLAPTFKDMKSTAEGAIAAMSQFGLKAKDLDSVLGSLNAVASKFAVESEDLISVIRRTGGVFKAAAGDIGAPKRQLNELAAIFTSVRSTTRESAESIATGLRTIFTRIQRPRSIQFLKELGVTVQDLEGKFVGPFEALNRLSAALKNLDPRDVRFAKIVEELGGFRQVGKLIPAIQQFGKAQAVLKVAMQGQDSLAKDAALAQKSLLIQATKVREEFQKLFRTVASSTSFRAFAKSALQLASSLIKVTEALTPVLPALTALGTIKAVGAVRGFGAGFFGGIRQGGGATGAGAGVAGAMTGQGGQRAATASQALSVSQKAQTVATQANTKALLALSTAIGRMPMGGGRRGFAAGGLVPGQGNRDTVPANLTPGEFVIRKSSVGQLGVDNLRSMNKMASGGRVSKRRTSYGGKKLPNWKSTHSNIASWHPNPDITESKLKGMGTTSDKWKTHAAEAEQAWAAAQDKTQGAAAAAKQKQAKKTGVSSRIDKGVLRIGKEGAPIVGMLSVRPEKGSSDIQSRTYSYNNEDAIIRTLKTVNMAANQKQVDKIQAKGGIKIPMSVGYIDPSKRQKFDSITKEGIASVIGNVMDIFSVKKGSKTLGKSDRGVSRAMKQIGIKDIQGKTFEAATAGLTGIFGKDDKARFDFNMTGAADIQKERMRELFGENTALTEEFLDAKMTASSTNISSIKDKTTSDKMLPHLKRHITAFNKGGSVDSVPALLTPGEFVINKGAASKIGLGNLNKMNQGQMPAFNMGGLVRGRRLARMRKLRGQGLRGKELREAMGASEGGFGQQAGFGAMFAGPMLQQAIGTSSGTTSAIGGAAGSAAMTAGTAAQFTSNIKLLGGTALFSAVTGAIKGLGEFRENLMSKELAASAKRVQQALEELARTGDATSLRSALGSAAVTTERQLQEQAGFGQFAQRYGGMQAVPNLATDALSFGTENRLGRTVSAELGVMSRFRGALPGGETPGEGFEKSLNAAFESRAEKIRNSPGAQENAQASVDLFASEFKKLSFEDLKGVEFGEADKINKVLKDSQKELLNFAKADAQLSKELVEAEATAKNAAQAERLRSGVLIRAANQIKETLGVQVRAQKKLELAVRSAAKAIDQIASAFEGIRGVIARVDDAMNNLSMTMMSNIRSSQGVAELNVPKNQIQNITGNLRAFSTKERRTAFGEMARATGARRGGALHKAVEVRELGFTLEKALPAIISKSKTLDAPKQIDFIKTQVQGIGGGGRTDAGKNFLSAVGNAIEARVSGENRQAAGLGELAADPKKIRQLVPAAEDAAKTIQAFGKAVDAQNQRTAKLTNEYTKLILASREAVRKVAEIGLERKAVFAEVSGRQQTVDELFEPFNQKIRSLSGGQVFGSQTQDVHVLEKRRVALEAERRIIQDRMNTFGKSKAETARLTARFALVSSALAENHKALQIFATDTTRAAAILGKLKDIDRRRAGARDFLGGLLTEGPDAARDRTMGMGLLGGVMSGAANVNQFTPDQNRLMLQALEDMKRVANLQGDTKAGQAAIKRLEDLEAKIFGQAFGPALGLLKGRGGPGDLLMGGLIGRAATPKRKGSEERDLIKRLGETFDTKKGGAEALARLAIGAHREFGKDLANQGVVFAAAFQTAFSNMNKEGFMINALPDVMLRGTTVPLEVIPRGRGKNAGGRIPGTGTSDTVPAMLTPGEFVVNASSAQANLGLLHSINKGGVQRFNKGGEVRDKFSSGLEQYIAGQIAPYDTDAEAKAAGLKAWPLGDYGFKVDRKLIEPDLAFERILPFLTELNKMGGKIKYGSAMGFHEADSSPGTGFFSLSSYHAADTKEELSKAASHSAAARYLKGSILPELNDASALGIWMHGDDARKSMLFEGMTKQSIFPKGVEAALAKEGEFHLTGASSLLPDNVVDFTSVAQQAHGNLRSSAELLIGENIQKLQKTKELTEKNIYSAFARAANASGSNLSLSWEQAFVSKSMMARNPRTGRAFGGIDTLIGRGEIDRIFVEKLLNGGGEPTGLATKYFGSDATKNSMRDSRHTLVKILASQQEKSQLAHAEASEALPAHRKFGGMKDFQKQSKDIFNLMTQAVSTDQLRKIHAEHAESEKTDALLRNKFPVNLLDPMTQAVIDARTGGYWRYMDTQQIHQELAKSASLSAKEVVGGLNYYPTSEQFKTGMTDRGQMNPDVQAKRMLKSLTARKYLDEARHFDPEIGRLLTQTTGAQLGPGKQRRGIRNFTPGDIISADNLTVGEKMLLAGGFGAQAIPKAMGQSVMAGLKTVRGATGAMGAAAAFGDVDIAHAIDDDVMAAAGGAAVGGRAGAASLRFAGARLGGLHESAVGVAQTAGALVDAVQNVVGKGQFEGVGQSLKVAAISGTRVLEGIAQVAGGRAGAAAENAKQRLAKAGVSKHLIRDFETAGQIAGTAAEVLAPHAGQIARGTIKGARTATAPIRPVVSEVAAQLRGSKMARAKFAATTPGPYEPSLFGHMRGKGTTPGEFLDDLATEHAHLQHLDTPSPLAQQPAARARSTQATLDEMARLRQDQFQASWTKSFTAPSATAQEARAALLQPVDIPIGPGQAATAPRFMTRPRALPKPKTPHLLRHTEAVLDAVGPPRDLHLRTGTAPHSSLARPPARPTRSTRLSDQALDAQIRAAERGSVSGKDISLGAQTQLGMDLTLAPLTKRAAATRPTVGIGSADAVPMPSQTKIGIKAAKKLERHQRGVEARHAGQVAKSQAGATVPGRVPERGSLQTVRKQMEAARPKAITDDEALAFLMEAEVPTAAAKPKPTTKPKDVGTAYQEEVKRLSALSDAELKNIADTELAGLGVKQAEAAATAKPTTTPDKPSKLPSKEDFIGGSKLDSLSKQLPSRRDYITPGKGILKTRRERGRVKPLIKAERARLKEVDRREKRLRKAKRKNAGGRIPGTGTSDTVPAMLTPGEFVVNAAASQANLGLLQSINTRGAVQRFADGGVVEDPDTGLWKATGGARLTRQQIMENRTFRGVNQRGLRNQRRAPAQRERAQREKAKKEDWKKGMFADDPLVKKEGYVHKASLKDLITSDDMSTASFMLQTLRTRPIPDDLDMDAIRSVGGKFASQKALEMWSTPLYGPAWGTGAIDKWTGVNARILSPKPVNGIEHQHVITRVEDENHKGAIEGQINGPSLSVGQEVDISQRLRNSWNNQLSQAFSQATTARLEKEADIREHGTALHPRMSGETPLRSSSARKRYSAGGSVDTVPAMLTPGEFVVNASAAQKNLSLLHSINDGNVQGFNLGGRVRKRYQRGGQEGRGGLFVGGQQLTDAMTAFNQSSTPALVAAMNTFSMSQQALTQALSGFESAAQQLYVAAESIGAINIPEKIVVELAPTSVGLTGETTLAAALANSIGGKLGQLISEAVGGTIRTNVDGTPAGVQR